MKVNRSYLQILKDNLYWIVSGFILLLVIDSYPNGLTFHQVLEKIGEFVIVILFVPPIIKHFSKYKIIKRSSN